MKDIYIIACGEYSDRQIIGYTETEEAARRIVAGLNREYDEYDYECIPYVEDSPDVVPMDVAGYFFRKTPNGWEMEEHYTSPTIGTAEDKCIVYYYRERELPRFYVTVAVSKFDREGCKRIAQDIFYQFIYRAKELFPDGRIDPNKLTEFCGYKVVWHIPKYML